MASQAERRRAQLDEAAVALRSELARSGHPIAAEPGPRGLAAAISAALDHDVPVDPSTIALATRAITAQLEQEAPGRTIELRIPPYSAVQLALGDGPRHTRGTPPSVVETDPDTVIRLAAGSLDWDEAVATRKVTVSGVHSDLSVLFPLSEHR